MPIDPYDYLIEPRLSEEIEYDDIASPLEGTAGQLPKLGGPEEGAGYVAPPEDVEEPTGGTPPSEDIGDYERGRGGGAPDEENTVDTPPPGDIGDYERGRGGGAPEEEEGGGVAPPSGGFGGNGGGDGGEKPDWWKRNFGDRDWDELEWWEKRSASGGGGGNGGGGEEEILEALSLEWWPTATYNQPLLREWTSWLRELVESNPMRAVPFPFEFEDLPEEEEAEPTEGVEAETYAVRGGDTMSNIAERYGVPLSALIQANPQITNPNIIQPGQTLNIPTGDTGTILEGEEEGIEGEEERETPPIGEAAVVPGFSSTRDVLKRVQRNLGMEFAEDMSPEERWQTFVNRIPHADLQTQQLLSSLAIDPESGQWYTRDVAQLVNPKYL